METPTTDRTPNKRRGWKIFGGLVLLLIGILLAGWGWLQTESGADWARRQIEAQVAANLNATVHIGKVSGNFWTTLHLENVALIHQTDTLLTTPAISATYALWPLLQQHLKINSLTIDSPTLQARADDANTWNWLAILPAADSADTTASPWAITLRNVQISNGSARMYTTPDAPLEIRNFHGDLAELLMPSDTTWSLKLNRLQADAYPARQSDPILLNLAGAWVNNQIHLDTLRLVSPHSNVAGRGTLALPGTATATPFALTAQPFDLQDLQAFWPDAPLQGQLNADWQSDAAEGPLTANLTATLPNGGTLAVECWTDLHLGTVAAVEAPRFELTAQTQRLDLEKLTGLNILAGWYNLHVNIAVQGNNWQDLSGTAEGLLTDSNLQGTPIQRGQIKANIADGAIRWTGDTDWGAGQLRAAGTVHPFDEEPRYTLSGAFQSLDATAFAPDLPDNLTGTVTLEGVGFDPETAQGEMTVRLQDWAYQTVQMAQTEAHLTFQNQRADGNLALTFAEQAGTIHTTGFVNWRTNPLQFELNPITFQNINLAPAINHETSSDLTGTLTLRGAGVDLATLTAEGRLTLAASTYGDYAITDTEFLAQLQQNRLNFSGTTALNTAQLTLTGAATMPFDPAITFTSAGQFTDLNLATFTTDTTLTTDLKGTFDLRGNGPWETLSAEVTLNIAPSTLREATLDEGLVELRLEDENLRFRADVNTSGGVFSAYGQYTDWATTPRYEITEGTVDNLNLAPWLANPALDSALHGTFTLTGQNTTRAAASATAHFNLTASRWNRATIENGTVDVHFQDEQISINTDLAFNEGQAQLTSTARPFANQPTFDVTGQLREVNVTALLQNGDYRSAVSADFDFTGTGTRLDSMALDGILTMGPSFVDDLTVDTLQTRLRVAEGIIHLDTLIAQSSALDLNGQGPITYFAQAGNPRSNFRFTGTLKNAAPLAVLLDSTTLAGEGTLNGQILGTPNVLQIVLNSDLQFLAYNDLHAAEFDGSLVVEYRNETLQARLREGHFRTISLPGFLLETLDLRGNYTSDSLLTFSTAFRLDSDRASTLRTHVDLQQNPPVIHVGDFTLQTREATWALAAPTRIIAEAPRYTIENLRLNAGENRFLSINGHIDQQGDVDLVGDVHQFQIGAVSDLLNYPGLGGLLNGEIRITGPAISPQITGELHLNEIVQEGRPLGQLTSRMYYNNHGLNLEGAWQDQQGNFMNIDGQIPINLAFGGTAPDLQNEPIDVIFSAEDLSLGICQLFIPADVMTGFRGRMNGEFVLGGTRGALAMQGQLDITNGQITLPILGVTYENISGQIIPDGDIARLENVRLNTGRGTLTASGHIGFEELPIGTLNLTVHGDRFLSAQIPEYRVVVSGNAVQVGGTFRYPEIRGAIVVNEADFYLTENLIAGTYADVELSPRDLQILESRFGLRVSAADTSSYELYRATALDLQVDLQRNTWFHSRTNPRMDIQFTGDLTMRKASGADEATMFGVLTAISERSRVEQFNRTFKLETGTLRFNGPMTEPILDLSAVYEVRGQTSGEDETEIRLTMKGPPDNLDFSLSSDPPMEEADMLSYITTGKPVEGFLNGQEALTNSAQALIGVAGGWASDFLQGVVSESLTLDVISLDPDPSGTGTLLTAGKYFGSQFYSALSIPLNTSSTSNGRLVLDYGFTKLLLFRLEYAYNSRLRRDGFGVSVKLEYAY